MKQRRKQGIRSIMAMLLLFAMVMSSMPTLNIKAQSNDETTSWGDDYKVTVSTPSQWYNGYNANITITNTSDRVIHNWHLAFYLADDITDLWNAQVVSNEEGIYVIKNDVTNQDIPVGESVSFGFTASNTLDVNLPTSYFMPTNTVSNDEATYQVNYDLKENWEMGFTASLEIVNKSENDFTDWTLEFDYDNKDQTFWEATLTSEEKSHIILNNLNYNQNIKKGEFLTLDFIGYPGDETKVPYGFKMSQIVFDESLLELDTDGDGLINRQELYLGSNPYNMDSDGDGLNDYFEVMNGLDPLLVDSDSNGIMDPVEDMDNDGLTVMEEYLLGTNIWDEDTDYDGLTDGDEVNKYYTNPLLEDTDEDGLLDGDEILLGLNPLVKDTDNNGIFDGDEKIQQEISVPIEDDVHKEITKVEVSMKGTGNIQNNTSITNTMGKDMLSSDVVGLIGVPVEIESTSKFDEATITFTYDDSLLGDTKEEDLSLMWYDEENNQYVILNNDSIVDTKDNTVSYVTTHFSTYMVVDSAKWYEVWSNALSYRRGSGVPEANKEFFDMSYVIDRSGSMSGSRITLAKESIKLFIDAMLEKDRASIVQFDSTAIVKSGFSNDKELLKRIVDTITASGGTSVDAGLTKALDVFNNEKNSKNSKMIVLLCDGDVNYTNETLKRAKDKKVKIYTVLIGSTSGMASLDKLAKETGGKSYYAASAEEIREAIFGVQRDTVGIVDTKDTDEDGLPDIFETGGMILSNGKYVYTDPLKKDTDGDGILDNEEMGVLKDFNEESALKQMVLEGIGFDSKVYAEYFDYRSDPTKKDTDGDGYDDKVDPRPLVSDVTICTLKDEQTFVQVYDSNKLYYGGNQDWFKDDVAKNGGCGTIAVTNIFAYISNNVKYKNLYSYNNVSINNYKQHMEDVYKYIKPYKLPFTEVPLGIWPIGKLQKGAEKYAKSKGVNLSGVRVKAKFNKKNTTKYIMDGINKDQPVAMLIGLNPKMKNITVTKMDGSFYVQDRLDLHWVTITEIKEDIVTKKTTLKVSTWGGYAYIDLDQYLKGEWIYMGLLYFS